jgi:hypothetical protein
VRWLLGAGILGRIDTRGRLCIFSGAPLNRRGRLKVIKVTFVMPDGKSVEGEIDACASRR